MERISENVNSSNKSLKILLGILSGFFLVAIIIAILYAHSENTDDKQKATAQKEARVAVCRAFNEQQASLRKSFHDDHVYLANTLVPNPTPEEQAIIDAYIKTTDEQLLKNLADRDCSIQGIEDYYSTSTTTSGGAIGKSSNLT